MSISSLFCACVYLIHTEFLSNNSSFMKKLIAYYVSCLRDDGVFEMRRLHIKRAACSISISLFFFSLLSVDIRRTQKQTMKFNVRRIKFSTKCENRHFGFVAALFFPMCLFFFPTVFISLSLAFSVVILLSVKAKRNGTNVPVTITSSFIACHTGSSKSTFSCVRKIFQPRSIGGCWYVELLVFQRHSSA